MITLCKVNFYWLELVLLTTHIVFRAQFQYTGGDDDELSFRRGEVFHVLDTMNGGTIGSWRAQRVLQSGAETEVGIIPNKCRYVTLT